MKTKALIEREKTRPATGPSAVLNDAVGYVHVVYMFQFEKGSFFCDLG